jgi:hypothetical protein
MSSDVAFGCGDDRRESPGVVQSLSLMAPCLAVCVEMSLASVMGLGVATRKGPPQVMSHRIGKLVLSGLMVCGRQPNVSELVFPFSGQGSPQLQSRSRLGKPGRR